MTRVLEVWLEGRHVGRFVRPVEGDVRFVYDDDAPASPISLSLPREGAVGRRAAGRFLENLLPDEQRTRTRMSQVYGASGPGTFDLLEKAGGDVAGGLVILPEGEQPPTGSAELNPALMRDIADRINAIKIDPDAWVPRDVPARFSLAGTQGKFALAKVDVDWYWSNATVPSTHILKPGRPTLRGLEAAEVAALDLAANAGVPAPPAAILHAEDQTAFIVERFDRMKARDGLLAVRLHAEDLAQALAIGPDAKYDATAAQLIGKLRTVDEGDDIVRAFLAQLAFNTLIGNTDAHAKNYSVLLRPSGVELAPIYDAVPVGLYPEFDQKLAMHIAGAHRPQAVSRDLWRKFARKVSLDEDEVVEIVSRVAAGIAEVNDWAWNALDEDQAATLRELVARNTEVVLGAGRSIRSSKTR